MSPDWVIRVAQDPKERRGVPALGCRQWMHRHGGLSCSVSLRRFHGSVGCGGEEGVKGRPSPDEERLAWGSFWRQDGQYRVPAGLEKKGRGHLCFRLG